MISYLNSFLFGLSVLVGVVTCSFLLWKGAKKNDLNTELVFDWSLVLIIAFLFFGRLTYIIENFAIFAQDFFRWIHLSRYPGISGSGGFLGMIVISFLYFRSRKINIWPYLDVFTLPFLYGYFFLGLGCLANGCVEGIKGTSLSFLSALRIRDFSHPVIIYSLVTTVLLISLFKRVGEQGLFKLFKRSFGEEKLPFKTDGLFFLSFFLLFSLVNLILALFTTDTIYFNNVNSKTIYFSFTALVSILLGLKKIGLANLIKLGQGLVKTKDINNHD